MRAAEPLHPTDHSHGKQGLGAAAHRYGWEYVGCWSSNVQYCIVLYLRHVLGHVANIREIWGCTNDCNNPRYRLVIQVLQPLLQSYLGIVRRDLA